MAWIYWPVALVDANVGWRRSAGATRSRAPVHAIEAHVHATAFAVVGHDQHLTQRVHTHPARILGELDIGTLRCGTRFHLAQVRPIRALFRRGVGGGPVGVAIHMQLSTLHRDAQAVVAIFPVARPVLQRGHGHRQRLQLAAVDPAGAAAHLVGEERAAVTAQVATGHHRIAVDHIAALAAGRFALGGAALHVAEQVQARCINHPRQREPALLGGERAIAAGAAIGDTGREGGGRQQRGQQAE